MEFELLLALLFGGVGAAVAAFMSRGKLRAVESTTTVRAKANTRTEIAAITVALEKHTNAVAELEAVNDLPREERLDEIRDIAADLFP